MVSILCKSRKFEGHRKAIFIFYFLRTNLRANLLFNNRFSKELFQLPVRKSTHCFSLGSVFFDEGDRLTLQVKTTRRGQFFAEMKTLILAYFGKQCKVVFRLCKSRKFEGQRKAIYIFFISWGQI